MTGDVVDDRCVTVFPMNVVFTGHFSICINSDLPIPQRSWGLAPAPARCHYDTLHASEPTQALLPRLWWARHY